MQGELYIGVRGWSTHTIVIGPLGAVRAHVLVYRVYRFLNFILQKEKERREEKYTEKS